MKKHSILSVSLAAMAAAFMGCSQFSEPMPAQEYRLTVTATVDNEDGHSRSMLQDGGKTIYWEPKDEIKVFSGLASAKLVSTNEEPSSTAVFTGVMAGSTEPSTDSRLYALYPYREEASCLNGVVTTTLPDIQYAEEGTFDRRANIAMAMSDCTDMAFRNVCGGLRFTLTQSGIRRIVFESTGGEYLAGEFSAQFVDDLPIVTDVTNGTSTIILEKEDGSTFEAGEWYYMSFLPCTLSNGYTVTFYKGAQKATLSVAKSQTIKRNTYGTLSNIDDGLSWEEIESPYDYVIATDMADWDEACFGRNGELIMLKENADDAGSGRAYMLLPSEANGIDEFYASFDAGGIPDLVFINGMGIRVVSRRDGQADVLVHVNDSLNVLIDSLDISFEEASTRSFSENNGVRNACAVARIVVGALEGGTGTVMFAASAASLPETGAAGAMGVYSGATTFRAGVDDVSRAYETLFAPATESYQGNWVEVLETGSEMLFEDAMNREIESYIDAGELETFNNLQIFKGVNMEQLGTAGNLLAYISLGIDAIDNLFGRTITERDRALMNYSGFSVVTGVLKDKGQNWATVSAYVGPDPYSRCAQWECGIILNGSDGSHAHYSSPVAGYFEHTFRSLKRGKSFVYQSYSHDKDHSFVFYGSQRTFETEGYPLAKIADFKQTDASKGSFSFGGRSYKYKFECTTTVTLDELDGKVEDWGYVYEDPQGNIANISLKGHSSPYSDSRYVFYRNESSSTACLYGYVKYKDEECLYDEPHDYPLEYEEHGCPDGHHPHAIDLGLPSGTKWACCNVGASTPEGYGGYYAWGETSEKSYYDRSTYSYYNSNTGYVNIGSDIAGTSYDVAHVRMGGSWRMPTHDQQMELKDYCSCTWTQQNGVNGILVTGPNGGQIFLPAAGSRWDDFLGDAGSRGSYVSSTLNPTSYGSSAYRLGFGSGFWDWYGNVSRDVGKSVRAVCP